MMPPRLEGRGSSPIQLPEWYARFTGSTARQGSLPSERDGTAVQIGPFTVFNAEPGCEHARFGRQQANVVLFDGFLFDRAELRRTFELDTETSDAELAAHAYQRWGEAVFDRLDGSYLLAVWDAEHHRLLLGHDAVGSHPAFYARQGDDFWFSPNVLALGRSGRIPSNPNRLSLALLAIMYWPAAGQTFFEAVRRIGQGSYLRLNAGGDCAEHRYWRPMPPDDEAWLPEARVREEFEPAIEQAVARSLQLSPQGIMLSGGLDSVTVAAVASKQLASQGRPPLVAVSGRTGGALSYEEVMQSKVAGALGMPHVISTTPEWRGGRDGVSLSLEATADLPAPSRTWWVGTYTGFYRTIAAQGLHVLLTGSGGDEWLGVADAHAADLLGAGRLLQLYRFIRAGIDTQGVPLPAALARRLWRAGAQPHLDTWWARLTPAAKNRYHVRQARKHLPDWLCPDASLRDALVECLVARRTPSTTRDGRRPASYYRHSITAAESTHTLYEAEIRFHVTSHLGLRFVSPYHDRRLITFFNRISPEQLVFQGRYKGLLRPLAVRHFPEFGLEQQRKTYSSEHMASLLDELRRGIAAAWEPERFTALGNLGVLDPARLRAAAGRGGAADTWETARQFALLSSERWLNQPKRHRS